MGITAARAQHRSGEQRQDCSAAEIQTVRSSTSAQAAATAQSTIIGMLVFVSGVPVRDQLFNRALMLDLGCQLPDGIPYHIMIKFAASLASCPLPLMLGGIAGLEMIS